MSFERIVCSSNVMGGKPCIRGTRVTAGTITGLVAAGSSWDAIVQLYPYIKLEDIAAALEYAAWRSEEVEVELKTA